MTSVKDLRINTFNRALKQEVQTEENESIAANNARIDAYFAEKSILIGNDDSLRPSQIVTPVNLNTFDYLKLARELTGAPAQKSTK